MRIGKIPRRAINIGTTSIPAPSKVNLTNHNHKKKMSDIQKHIGKEKLPSIINDPFKKSKVKSIRVHYGEKVFGIGWHAYGVLEFQNGNTTGEQKFNGETFDDVVASIKEVLNQLEG
jgi:ABC-type antimicrobial peptide transport system permease subunit